MTISLQTAKYIYRSIILFTVAAQDIVIAHPGLNVDQAWEIN